jgi:hypothetical protein
VSRNREVRPSGRGATLETKDDVLVENAVTEGARMEQIQIPTNLWLGRKPQAERVTVYEDAGLQVAKVAGGVE